MKGYTDLKKIGSGGMAVVYKATQESLERPVAIKKLHSHLSTDERFIQRFTIEAHTASSLRHQNIVTVYDFGKDEETHYIVMEYLIGYDLEYYLSQKKPLSIEISLLIIQQVCEGLSYAHQKGVIHRDIKPANIFIADDGVVKLTDFGIAQLKEFHSLTPAGAIIGTPSYISPEQILGEKIGPPADIFSIGVILYRIICNEFPFKGETTAEILHKIAKEEFEEPRKKNFIIPKEVDFIIKKCLAKKPEERFATVEEIIEKLDGYLYSLDLINSIKEVRDYVKDPFFYCKNLTEKLITKHLKKGKFFQQQNKLHEALEEFETVLALDPNNENVSLCLKQIEEKEYKITPETQLIEEKTEKKIKKKAKIKPLTISAILFLFIAVFLTFKLLEKSLLLSSQHKQKSVFNSQNKKIDFVKKKSQLENTLNPSAIKKELPKELKTPVTTLPPKPKQNISLSKKTSVLVPSLSKTQTHPEILSNPATLTSSEEKKEFGTITIFSKPFTKVSIDGKIHNNAPFSIPLRLIAGEHQLKLENPEYKPYEGIITILPNKNIHYKITLIDSKTGIWQVEIK